MTLGLARLAGSMGMHEWIKALGVSFMVGGLGNSKCLSLLFMMRSNEVM